MTFLNQYFFSSGVAPQDMDKLWEQGWRHFGTEFYRYSLSYHMGELRTVMPLRIDLTRFAPSRSQKRVLARNPDLRIEICATQIDAAKEALFYQHRHRFRNNVPDSLYGFLSQHPASVPCRNDSLCVYADEQLLAVTFLDIGAQATSGVYAMFAPQEARRSLGIFMILQSISYSRNLACRYYYPGYAYYEPSVYDYKKGFAGLEYLDWQQGWRPYSKEVSQSVTTQDTELFIIE